MSGMSAVRGLGFSSLERDQLTQLRSTIARCIKVQKLIIDTHEHSTEQTLRHRTEKRKEEVAHRGYISGRIIC